MTKYIHHDLGELKAGMIAEVTLNGNGANVRLLDAYNFDLYQQGLPCQFFGGKARVSPYKLMIPTDGHWHIAVDMVGLSGQTSAITRILAGNSENQ